MNEKLRSNLQVWHLIVGLVSAGIVATASGAYAWASVTGEISHLAEKAQKVEGVPEKLARIETALESQGKAIERIETKLDRR